MSNSINKSKNPLPAIAQDSKNPPPPTIFVRPAPPPMPPKPAKK